MSLQIEASNSILQRLGALSFPVYDRVADSRLLELTGETATPEVATPCLEDIELDVNCRRGGTSLSRATYTTTLQFNEKVAMDDVLCDMASSPWVVVATTPDDIEKRYLVTLQGISIPPRPKAGPVGSTAILTFDLTIKS